MGGFFTQGMQILGVLQVKHDDLRPPFRYSEPMNITWLDWSLRVLLLIFSGVGLWSCSVFAIEQWRTKRGKGGPIELVCKDGSCLVLSRTRWAHMFFGIPNWYFGFGFYIITIFTAIFLQDWLFYLDLAATAGAVLISLILIYGLLFKLKAFCKFCYIAHAANAGIALIWILTIALAWR